ncbi:alpha-galactosidase [Methanocella sp. CWC-04]|uniref:Alpha-galactosidase n=1 Tax=Methanooceanicella nereidis TaxID=2052831 RepID=A0AAP2W8T1_9EURY|nr:NEW3 domain-containing protein [Methanocella sp. CWC-04]MCD1296336.1 alpha-galactosidase [Methanocella sp. CWC-04]
MKNSRIILPLLMLLLTASAIPASADSGYQTVYSNWVNSGEIVQANGCYVNITVAGPGYVHAVVKSPEYPDGDVTISTGNSYYYYGVIKIYVVEVDESIGRALVDISKPVDSVETSGTTLTCDVPGQLALGGDSISFPIIIKNDNGDDKTYTLSSSSDAGWETGFMYGDKGIYKIYVPQGQSKTVNLVVETTASSDIGEKKVTAKVDSLSIDLYVYITSVNQTTEISSRYSSKISSIGEKSLYELSIKNIQSTENSYGLSVDGLPENWYYRFKESSTSTDEMAEVIVPADSVKTIILEIVPPYSVTEGEYNFTAKIETPDGVTIEKDLTLKLKSSVGMTVTSSKLAYDSKPGETFSIDVYVTNDGTGGTLTNVNPEVTAPDGWVINCYPEMISTIKAGETQKFTISVQSPGNIVASDYEVDIDVNSDQVMKEKTYRITIATESYIPYIGGAIIIMVLAGLVLVFRKYGRR